MLVDVEVETRIRPLTVDEVIHMAHVGIIDERERVELIDGVLVTMSPEGRPHAATIMALTGMLSRVYPWPEFGIRVNTTQPISETAYRLPDLEIIRMATSGGGWPEPRDLLLVVEVAETSLQYDLGRKARDYARWGAPRYWVVDLANRCVIVHEQPGDAGYRTITTVREDGAVDLPEVGGDLTVAELLIMADRAR